MALGVFTTKRYTNPHLPYLYLTLPWCPPLISHNFFFTESFFHKFTVNSKPALRGDYFRQKKNFQCVITLCQNSLELYKPRY